MPLRSQRVVLRVAIANTTKEHRSHEVRLRSSGGVVQVDETEVSEIAVGDSAAINGGEDTVADSDGGI